MKAERLFWFDAFGEFHDLEAEGIVPFWGQAGAHMPPVRIVRNAVGGTAGSTLQLVVADVRPYSVPCAITSTSESSFRSTMDRIARMFDPTNGTGILRFVRSDDTYRELTCICVSGLALTESEDARGPGWVETVLEFEADYPYWEGPTFSTSWMTDAAAGAFFPIFPLILGSSNVIGEDQSIVIDSDAPVYPTWEIEGPATAITFTSQATGRVLAWAGTMASGDLLTIDTKRETVKFLASGDTPGEDETNAYGGLTAWDFWPFRTGTNLFDIDVTDATSATRVVANWREGHNGP